MEAFLDVLACIGWVAAGLAVAVIILQIVARFEELP